MSYADPRARQIPGDDSARQFRGDDSARQFRGDDSARQFRGDGTSVAGPGVPGPGPDAGDPFPAVRQTEDVLAYTGESTTEAGTPDLESGRTGPGRRRAGRGRKPGGGSRAGRNLPAAIAVGLSLGLVILASLLIQPVVFLVVLVAAAGIGAWEMARALSTTGARPPLVPLIAGSVLMTGLAWFEGADALVLGLLVTIGAAALWRLADGAAAVRRDFTPSVLIAVYGPFLLSFAAMLTRLEDGPLMVICTVAAVVLSDTGGYASGVFLGKHPMAPRISPKKSWEGFAGSVTAAAIGSSALLFFLLDVPVYWGLLFGAVISVMAVAGDLAESMLKRDLRVKDMSNLLPGHGGLMDRLDSILFAVPTAYLLFSIITPS